LIHSSNSKIRTVADLARYLETQKISPEAFAVKCSISNMTFRRMLSKKPQHAVPQKYWAALDLATGGSSVPTANPWADLMGEDFGVLEQSLEEDGAKGHDLNKLEDDISIKTKAAEVGKKLKELVTTVFNAVKSDKISTRDRFLAIGALLYFLNPIDLIPDALPGVGYLDDFAVLTMVAARLANPFRAAAKDAKNSDKTET
jgi:uncharacterized membrane protein YkvA (DUF1232 family)